MTNNGFTKKDWEDRYEQWSREYILQGGGDPEDEKLRKEFLSCIEGAKNLEDLITRIDKFDPRAYKLIKILGKSIRYLGVKIKIKFRKEGGVFIIPEERLSYLSIPSSIIKPGTSWSWVMLKELP